MSSASSKELYKMIPFGVAVILVLSHIVEMYLRSSDELTYGVLNSVRNAGLGLCVVSLLILVNNPVWKYVFALLALLATLTVVKFASYTLGLRFGVVSIDFISLSILYFHFAMDPALLDALKARMKSKPESEASIQARFERSVVGYSTALNKKSTVELRRIVEQNTHVPAAVEAARRILEGR